MRKPTGPASRPLYPQREVEVWTCDACGAEVLIQVPAKQDSYKHSTCTERPQGRYRP